MTTPAAQTTPRAPGEREPIPGGRESTLGGREPISSGAPPGAPPEGVPFHSALEIESARTAIAEGQQKRSQDPAPAAGEKASTAGVSDRVPHGAAQPAPPHRGQHPAAVSSGSRATSGFGSSTPTPAASTLTLPAALPGSAWTDAPAGGAWTDAPAGDTPTDVPAGSTSTDVPALGALTGRDVIPGSAAHLPAQPGSATVPGGSLTSGEEGIPNPHAAATRGDSSPGSTESVLTPGTAAAHEDVQRSPTTGPADGTLALLRDGAPTSGALTTPLDGATAAIASATPRDGAPPAGGAQAHSTHAAPGAGALADRLGGPAHKEGTGAGGENWSSQTGARTLAKQAPPLATGADAHDKLWVPDPAQAPAGAAAGSGAATTGGVGGLAAGAGAAQASAPAGGDQGEPLIDYGVGLQQAIETLHGTIQLAARQGLSQARIALEPEGLGEIRINLTQTSQGLLARVSAETPIAAQALAAAHAELRQSLSSLGLNLARLSIGAHSHSAAHGGDTALGGDRGGDGGSGDTFSRGARGGQSAASTPPTNPAPEIEAEEDAHPGTAPSRGTLLDVLA